MTQSGECRGNIAIIALVLFIAVWQTACTLPKALDEESEIAYGKDGSKIEIRLLTPATSNVIRSVDVYATATIEVRLTTAKIGDESNAVVQVATTIGSILPRNGSTLTDSSGVATATLVAGSVAGAGVITASYTSDAGAVNVSYSFDIKDNQLSGGDTGGGGTGGTGDGLSGSDAPTEDETTTTEPEPSEPAPVAVVIGTVKFTSAEPEVMALRGTGGLDLSETSIVTFTVVDENNQPVTSQKVDFKLNTDVGGLRLYPESRLTDSRGMVSTFVYAGTVATAVRVTASTTVTASDTNNYTISSQSDRLVVSSGLPDQNSFSVGVTVFNPEAADFFGKTVDIGATVGDQYNNQAPDGTTVYFTAEGGSIAPHCFTKAGTCSVKWTSSWPLPSDHRINILATTIGNESFTDIDADGYFTNKDGEPFTDTNNNGILDEPFTDTDGDGMFDEPFVDTNANGAYNPGEPFTDFNRNGVFDGNEFSVVGESAYTDVNGNGVFDGTGYLPTGESYTDVDADGKFDGPGFADLGEPYLDANENGQYDAGEYFADSTKNGAFDAKGDGKFTGNICLAGSNCSTASTLYVRTQATIIASGSYARMDVIDADTKAIYASNYLTSSGTTIDIRGGGKVNLLLRITDEAGQVMPSGTKIVLQEEVDGTDVPVYTASFNVPNTLANAAKTYKVTFGDEAVGVNSTRALMLRVTTPSGAETSLSLPMND